MHAKHMVRLHIICTSLYNKTVEFFNRIFKSLGKILAAQILMQKFTDQKGRMTTPCKFYRFDACVDRSCSSTYFVPLRSVSSTNLELLHPNLSNLLKNNRQNNFSLFDRKIPSS